MRTGREVFLDDEGKDGAAADVPRPQQCRPHRHAPGVRAMKLTRYNKVAAKVWLGPCAKMVNGGVAICLDNVVRVAYEGDWIVKPYTSLPYVLPDDAFHRLYEIG